MFLNQTPLPCNSYFFLQQGQKDFVLITEKVSKQLKVRIIPKSFPEVNRQFQNPFPVCTPFLALDFIVCSVNEKDVMCFFVIVLLNSSRRQHTPVFSSLLQVTGHDPSPVVPLSFPTVLPSSICVKTHIYLARIAA